ncbi:MAG: UDP-N-acetylglucosamine 2-epimerase (non-hydrolyzing) [Deltaproteobacteria bacterium]|nr:UDP-N-acetylglucosamine 2-epimerase (non-hydrolyzing) [Deltaproteobacteria bacterium]
MPSTVLHVVGARPNFMKMAPLLRALASDAGREHLLVHTGQHYDEHLNDAIFRDLGLRAPDIHLGVGSGSHAEQTAKIMVSFERVVAERRPAMVVVAGDVNSTIACAIVAAKAGVAVAHVEAGLRSFDRSMPEEINRIVTDRLTDLYLTPSPDADENLAREGVDPAGVVRVGNLMVDSVFSNLERARKGPALERLGLQRHGYALLTLHRPSNVDDPAVFARLLDAIEHLGRRMTVVFPVHPRTRARMGEGPLAARVAAAPGLKLTEPLGYLEFLQLQDASAMVLTDSGGIQEETTVLGVPCLTLRENTERPITITEGTNTLVGTSPERIVAAIDAVAPRGTVAPRIPDLWDGHAGPRAAAAIDAFLARRGV